MPVIGEPDEGHAHERGRRPDEPRGGAEHVGPHRVLPVEVGGVTSGLRHAGESSTGHLHGGRGHDGREGSDRDPGVGTDGGRQGPPGRHHDRGPHGQPQARWEVVAHRKLPQSGDPRPGRQVVGSRGGVALRDGGHGRHARQPRDVGAHRWRHAPQGQPHEPHTPQVHPPVALQAPVDVGGPPRLHVGEMRSSPLVALTASPLRRPAGQHGEHPAQDEDVDGHVGQVEDQAGAHLLMLDTNSHCRNTYLATNGGLRTVAPAPRGRSWRPPRCDHPGVLAVGHRRRRARSCAGRVRGPARAG